LQPNEKRTDFVYYFDGVTIGVYDDSKYDRLRQD